MLWGKIPTFFFPLNNTHVHIQFDKANKQRIELAKSSELSFNVQSLR